MNKAVGICKAYLVRWRYNPETQKCEEFVYGGCRGNANNFQEEDQCLAVCKGKKSNFSEQLMKENLNFCFGF